MKHLFLALSLLGLICAASLWATARLEADTAALTAQLEAAQNAESRSAALESAEQAASSWKTAQNTFAILLSHEETDTIQFQFSALLVCPEEEFAARCQELIARLEHLAELDRPLLHNIF